VLQRFRNPVIVHRLDQIAQDGSQKLPYRLGDTLVANRRAGRMPTGVVAALGAWVAFLMQRARDNIPIVDPAGDRLADAARAGTPAEVVARLIDAGLGFPPELREDAAARSAIADTAELISRGDWSGVNL